MAEQRGERRERRGWLIALVVLFVAIGAWRLIGHGSDDASRGSDPRGDITGGARPASGALGGFVQYVDERRSYGAAVREPELTAEGIRRLADAIAEVANRNVARAELVRATVDSLLRRAEVLRVEDHPIAQAQGARESFLLATDAIRAMQEHGFPTLAELSAEARAAAEAVSARTPLVEQTAAVQSFFERAASALRNMAPQAV